jgi:hypothetical protein
MERPEPVDVEICPECGGTNIGGRKNCYGPPDAKHDPVRFEFRQFLPASYADHLEQRVRELEDVLEWIGDAERVAEQSDVYGWAVEAHDRARAALTPPTSEGSTDDG